MNAKETKIIAYQLIDSGLLSHGDLDSFLSECDLHAIAPDGSTRKFFRVHFKGKALCVGVWPAMIDELSMAEAKSAHDIGCHLNSKNLAIPKVLGFDEETGLLLFEDCGDTRLHDLLLQRNCEKKIHEIVHVSYPEVVRQLVRLQIMGAEGFHTHWCYDTPRFDEKLMVSKESNYFLKEFCSNLVGIEVDPGIADEFNVIAENAGKGDNNLFLHRDFQCRNIMMVESGVRIIDFQGGRLGPSGYDLASLLIDPYAALPQEHRENLLDLYVQEFSKIRQLDRGVFLRQFGYLQLQRNMQILGAFSFLWKKRGKLFFKEFIEPSLFLLHQTLNEYEYKEYTLLRKTVEKALNLHKRYR